MRDHKPLYLSSSSTPHSNVQTAWTFIYKDLLEVSTIQPKVIGKDFLPRYLFMSDPVRSLFQLLLHISWIVALCAAPSHLLVLTQIMGRF